jgi:hypothetical protein
LDGDILQAIKTAIALFCIIFGMGIINNLGIMDVHTVPDATPYAIQANASDGIANIGSSSTSYTDENGTHTSGGGGSDEELSNNLLGWGAAVNVYQTFATFLGILILPYYFIYEHSGRADFALMVQAVLNISTALALFQIWTKFGLGEDKL